MNATYIPLDNIELSACNPRGRVTSRTEVADLLRTIPKVGLLCPILVQPQGDQYSLVAGERRLTAYRILYEEAAAQGISPNPFERIPALVQTFDDKLSVFRAQLAENEDRVSVALVAKARAVKQLQDEQALSQSAVGELLGKSQDYASKLLAVASAEAAVQYQLLNHEVSLDDAVLLIRIHQATPASRREKRIQTLAQKRASGEMSREALRQVLAGTRRGNPAAKKPVPRPSLFTVERDVARFRSVTLKISDVQGEEASRELAASLTAFFQWLSDAKSPVLALLAPQLRACASDAEVM